MKEKERDEKKENIVNHQKKNLEILIKIGRIQFHYFFHQNEIQSIDFGREERDEEDRERIRIFKKNSKKSRNLGGVNSPFIQSKRALIGYLLAGDYIILNVI